MSAHLNTNFIDQIAQTRKAIHDSFKRSHEALRIRENSLLSRVEEIEKDFNTKTQTGNIYIADSNNNHVQVFNHEVTFLFMFSERVDHPIGICIFLNKVFVIQYGSSRY